MKKWILGVGVILIVLVSGILIHQLSSFAIEESALEEHIAVSVNRGANSKSTIEIEESNDIGDLRTFLFTVHDEDMPNTNRMLGFAFYEKSWLGNKYRLDGLGWGTNTFDSYLFEASVRNKVEKFLVVYGKNPSESKEFVRFKVNVYDDIYIGNLSNEDYFVEVFPVTSNHEENAMSSISFETEDGYMESYPLIITSTIK